MGRGSRGTGESWDVPGLQLVYNWSTIGLQLVYNWSIGTPSGSCAKWIVRKAVAGFGPERFQTTNNITRTVNATNFEKYPSRDKFEMAHHNVSLVNFCTISISRTNLY